MKDVLNFFGVFISVILSIVLSVLLFTFVILLNVKTLVSKKGLNDLIDSIDIVEVMKVSDDGEAWKEAVDFGKEFNLDEKQVEEFLKSDKIKDEISTVFSDLLDKSIKGEKFQVSKEDTEKFIGVVIEEYNKVSDEKITPELEKQINELISDDIVAEINKEFENVDIKSEMPVESEKFYDGVVNFAFGSASFAVLGVVIFVIGLIALLRFSYYKWMPYFGVSAIFSSILLAIVAAALGLLNTTEISFISAPVIGVISKHIYIGVAILMVFAIASFIVHHILKKKHLEPNGEPIVLTTN